MVLSGRRGRDQDVGEERLNAKHQMKPGSSVEGVHPTEAGYAIMRPLALAAIADTLGR